MLQQRTVQVSDETVRSYRERGFVRIPGVLSPEEVQRYREAVVAFRERGRTLSEDASMFAQYVDVWQQDTTLADLTLHPGLAAVAERLAGVPLRLWHDHVLIKDPHNGVPTEYHQDQPFWPHAQGRHALSAWVALVDVPVERGCMSFIPGSFRQAGLAAQNLHDHHSLEDKWPEATWQERVTIPLRAGDCTFHNSWTAHTANSNDTDEARIAHVVIYMDAGTRFDGRPHPVTSPMDDLQAGEPFPDARFPRFGA